MKLQIIETPEYILAVSDEEIKPIKDYVLRDLFIMKPNTYNLKMFPEYKHKKIIAYQPKGNAPKLDLPLLPEMGIEDDVEKMAENYSKKYDVLDQFIYEDGFKQGHKTATKVYSEEDMWHCYHAGKLSGKELKNYEFRDYIQSLKQPTPKWFVAERDTSLTIKGEPDYFNYDDGTKLNPNVGRLKTTTINGETYLVGKYLYK